MTLVRGFHIELDERNEVVVLLINSRLHLCVRKLPSCRKLRHHRPYISKHDQAKAGTHLRFIYLSTIESVRLSPCCIQSAINASTEQSALGPLEPSYREHGLLHEEHNLQNSNSPFSKPNAGLG
jgi:hypothetical protein